MEDVMTEQEWRKIAAHIVGMWPRHADIGKVWVSGWYHAVAPFTEAEISAAVLAYSAGPGGAWPPNGGELAAIAREARGDRPADNETAWGLVLREASRVGAQGRPDFSRAGDHPVDAAFAERIVATVGWSRICRTPERELGYLKAGTRELCAQESRTFAATPAGLPDSVPSRLALGMP
jgi:hypothetical protein